MFKAWCQPFFLNEHIFLLQNDDNLLSSGPWMAYVGMRWPVMTLVVKCFQGSCQVLSSL